MLHEFDLLEATHKYEKERLTWVVNDQSKPFYNRPWATAAYSVLYLTRTDGWKTCSSHHSEIRPQ